MKKTVITASLTGLFLLSLVSVGIVHYQQLDKVPYGFHVDEMSTSVDVGCLATEGVDAHNVPHPMFSNLNYGTPKPPTYLYPAVVWAKFFGFSVPRLRAFSVTVFLLGVIGLFLLARRLFGWHYAFVVLTVASLSPWTWGISRIAFESAFAMTFTVWGLYFFIRSSRWADTILAAVFFAAAMYSYPPFRVGTPLMLIALCVYSYRHYPRSPKLWLAFGAALVVLSIPLIQRVLSGELQQRFNAISILHGQFKDVAGVFCHNYRLHLRPDFLFFKGDPSLVHSTGHFGILSWLDMLALALVLVNPKSLTQGFIIFLIVNILLAIVPSALTNSELPNSLRIIGAWPFMCLFSGYMIWQACERWWGLWPLVLTVSICFAAFYSKVYFKVYPDESKGMFAFWTLEQAGQLRSDEQWLNFVLLYRYQDYNARYFMMQYKGLTCTQSRHVWEGMRDLLKSKGMY